MVAFHVGDQVRVHFGPRKYRGVIVEERGPIGGNGRQLFTVEVPFDPEPLTLERSEDEIELVAKRVKRVGAPKTHSRS